MRAHRTIAFSLGLLAVAALGLSGVLRPGMGDAARGRLAELPAWLGAPAREPVLVVVLAHPRGLADVRAAIPAERIVAESAAAFAVRERRLVSSSFDEVGPVLVAAGWQHAPLEIVALRPRPPRQRLSADPADRVSALMSQPTLTLLEARSLLGTL